jgi:hypothetical protein
LKADDGFTWRIREGVLVEGQDRREWAAIGKSVNWAKRVEMGRVEREGPYVLS